VTPSVAAPGDTNSGEWRQWGVGRCRCSTPIGRRLPSARTVRESGCYSIDCDHSPALWRRRWPAVSDAASPASLLIWRTLVGSGRCDYEWRELWR